MTTTQHRRRNELLSQIEDLKINRRYYYAKIGKFGNAEGEDALLEHIVRTHDGAIRKLNEEFQQLERIRFAEYYKSDTHKSLHATSGLNGSQILMLNSKKSA